MSDAVDNDADLVAAGYAVLTRVVPPDAAELAPFPDAVRRSG